jgi:DNA invertase Pin-like site-specific DNA recombinase
VHIVLRLRHTLLTGLDVDFSSLGGYRMNRSINPPLVARDGHKLRVLAVCRISTINQDEKSLDDQEASYRNWLDANTDLPYELKVIASQGSGECIDRDSYTQAIDLVESGQFDLVISEDLGRICRRVHAHIFCETCEDAETRLIALNDNVDTGCEGWQLNSFFAAIKHESYNRDTSKRIRRTLRNRFSQGGVFQCEIYGYVNHAVPRGRRMSTKIRWRNLFMNSGFECWNKVPATRKWQIVLTNR